MSKKINLKDKRFGRLTVYADLGRRHYGQLIWDCKCDCGNFTEVRSDKLRNGTTRSCGCLRRELQVKKMREMGRKNKGDNHGMSEVSMKRRDIIEKAEDLLCRLFMGEKLGTDLGEFVDKKVALESKLKYFDSYLDSRGFDLGDRVIIKNKQEENSE